FTADGRPLVAFDPAGGRQTGSGFQTLTVGAHVYVIPFDAAGYLGAPLDLSLFDVTALAAAGYADAATPLALDVSGSTANATLPGIVVDAHGKGSQARAGAAQFGRALAADRKARKQGVATPTLFAGVDRIAVAGSAPAATAGAMVPPGQPAGKLYTLTVKGFDQKGQKVFGNFGVVYNVDDGNTFLAAQRFFNGTFAYSVPAGNYQVSALISTGTTAADTGYAFVTAEVAVKSSTVVVLEARKSTLVAPAVPDPTRAVIAEMTLQRNAAQGPSFADAFTAFGPVPLYVSPERPVTVGQQYFYPYFRFGDAAGGLDRYVYDLQLAYIGGIPDNLQPVLGRADFATFDATYHSSSPGRVEAEGRIALAPWQSSAGLTPTDLTAPLTRTEYVLPRADTRWLQVVVTDSQEFAGFATDTWRAPGPGDRAPTDWTSQPEPPGIEQEPAGVAQDCPACRSGDTLSTTFFPYVDKAGNRTVPDPEGAMLSLYDETGTLLDSRPSSIAQFALPPSLGKYSLALDLARDADWWPTTVRTHTVWTFESSERAPDDIVPAGHDATIDVTVQRQAFAPAAAIASFTFDVSFDDGASWTPAAVGALGRGRFQVTYPQPALAATSGFASFRINATDEEGSALEQEIVRAYPLGAVAPAGGGDGTGTGSPRFLPCTTAVAAPYAQCMAMAAPASGKGGPGPVGGYGPAE
ncbi:MAG TPA: hypothetical protein VJX66_22185, partial [Amycolatopsis sp.]|nr:hypothetical protein [Amycolatopsis sp.]